MTRSIGMDGPMIIKTSLLTKCKTSHACRTRYVVPYKRRNPIFESEGVGCPIFSRAMPLTLFHHHPTPDTEQLLYTNWAAFLAARQQLGRYSTQFLGVKFPVW